MALTAQQLVDVRRFCGYSLSGNATAQPYRELIYSDVSYMGLSLDYRLDNLSPEEETVITTKYLPNLNAREREIQCAAQNLDTDIAAIWTHNKSEVSDRVDLFNYLRRQLCSFLGFAPGPSLLQANRAIRG
jgi:hypothetical protein